MPIGPRKSEKTQITRILAHPTEQRKAKRYRLTTAAIFRWVGPDNKRFQGEGATRDMSVEGVFILTATCPPANAVVQMEVVLPLSGGSSKAEMKADMMVLRVEHDIAGVSRSGFSAVGEGFSLRTFSERASRLVEGLIKGSEASMKGQE